MIDHPEFIIPADSGKNRLYNVLNAYANFDEEVGYCQGMNFITAMLLFNIIDEEDVFWCLIMILMSNNRHPVLKIRGRHNWRMCFVPSMEKVITLQ